MERKRMAVLDEHGNRTEVIATFSSINVGNLSDGPRSIAGLPTLRTLDGESLRVQDGELVAIESGRRFTPI